MGNYIMGYINNLHNSGKPWLPGYTTYIVDIINSQLAEIPTLFQ